MPRNHAYQRARWWAFLWLASAHPLTLPSGCIESATLKTAENMPTGWLPLGTPGVHPNCTAGMLWNSVHLGWS